MRHGFTVHGVYRADYDAWGTLMSDLSSCTMACVIEAATRMAEGLWRVIEENTGTPVEQMIATVRAELG